MVAVVELIYIASHRSLLKASADVTSPRDWPRPHSNRHPALHGAIIGTSCHVADIRHLSCVERPEHCVLIVPCAARPSSLLAQSYITVLDVVMRCDFLLLRGQIELWLEHIRHVDVRGLSRADVLIKYTCSLLVV